MARIASHRPSNGQPPNSSGNFRALLLGSACNSFSFFGEQVVVGYVVFELTESSIWVGVSLALYFAPMFFFGLASGAIADWASDRRILMRRTQMSLGAVLSAPSACDVERLLMPRRRVVYVEEQRAARRHRLGAAREQLGVPRRAEERVRAEHHRVEGRRALRQRREHVRLKHGAVHSLTRGGGELGTDLDTHLPWSGVPS